MPHTRFLQAGLMALAMGLSFVARPAHAQLSFRLETLQTPEDPSVGSFAHGISANGTILGSYGDSTTMIHGYIRSPNGAYTTLDYTPPTPPYPSGYTGTWMFGGINNAGDVTGEFEHYTSNGDYLQDNFIYHNGMFSRPQVAGSTLTYYYNVNEAGQVATNYRDAAGHYHSAIYDLATSSLTLLPNVAGYTNTSILTILPNGAVVENVGNGVIDPVTGDEYLRGSITLNNVTTFFDAPGALDTRVDDVTSTGLYAGNYLDTSHIRHGFIYDTTDSQFYTIDGDPNAIYTTLRLGNNDNQFTGWWYGSDGTYHSLLVTAVPEPGSVALLVSLSVAGAGFLRRKTRKVRAC